MIPTPTLAPAGPPLKAIIEEEWPKKLEIGRSDSIRVSLIRTTGQVLVPTIEIPGHTVIVATPISVGTPEAPIEKAFGPKYEALATASLYAAAFRASPTALEYQSLEQSKVTWEWNIVPEHSGQQYVNLGIKVQWKPVGAEGQLIERQIWSSRLDINVEKPLITIGQLNLFSLISGAIGSALSIPWLYGLHAGINKRKKEGRTSD